MSNPEFFAFRDKLNEISPSFCAAKWMQVTLHLHSGYNHSCHHPGAHQTPLSELKDNPSALHNTKFKKELRRQMKEGVRPDECDYCWNIEDLGPDFLSDRTFKSSETWSAPYLEILKRRPHDININPTYVEVSFSNVCNFRCSYCSANFSTRWEEDLRRHGDYTTGSGQRTMEILKEEENPYIDAFWKWWPSLNKDLQVFRITGGEPLLSKNTFRVLEDLVANPKPHLEVAINSNLGISDATFQKFIALVKDITENKKVRRFRLYTSAEAWGEKAEYIRNGMEFSRFQRNLETYLREITDGNATIMCTFNALSVTSFLPFLQYVRKHKKRTSKLFGDQLTLDISYLRQPTYQTVQVLPPRYIAMVEECYQFMTEHMVKTEHDRGFNAHEVVKLERILEWMKAGLPEAELKKQRRQFHEFFSQHDRRRDTNFLKAFPEMQDFWDSCKESSVTLGLVVRNEEQQIEDCLNQMWKVVQDDNPEIIIVDNNSTDGTVKKIQEWSRAHAMVNLSVIRNDDNNMAKARNQILRTSISEWVYFTDADCRLRWSSWKKMCSITQIESPRGNKAFGGGNCPPDADSYVNEGLTMMADSLWAHMGSIQIKPPRDLRSTALLSTSNLLVPREKALQSGGFDEAYAKTGEDLSLSHRLQQNGTKLMSVPEMEVLHLQDRGILNWCKKMFRYGQAQVHVAARYPQHFFGRRGLQFLCVWAYLALCLFEPLWAFKVFIAYSALVFLTLTKAPYILKRVRGTIFITLSHALYAAGEVAAIFTLPAFILANFPKRIPLLEKK